MKISSQYNLSEIEENSPEEEFLDLDLEANRRDTCLYMSEEIKHALDQSNDAFNKILKEEYDKASKAIVLWQPPVGILSHELTSFGQKNEDDPKEETSSAEPASENQLNAEVFAPMDAGENMDL